MSTPKQKMSRRFKQSLVSWITRGMSWIACRISLRSLHRIADAFAWLIRSLSAKRRRMALSNIAQSFPEATAQEVERIFTLSVKNISRTMMELLRLPSMQPEDVAALMDTVNEQYLLDACAEGNGVVLITAHYGNWEWAGSRIAGLLGHVAVLARDADHNVTAGIINRSRASHNMHVLSRDDLRGMLRVLNNGEVLAILPDQHMSSGGVLVDFLGRPGWTATGPATLALRTGAVVVGVFSRRRHEGGFDLVFKPRIELERTGDREKNVIEATKKINAMIEEAIRESPEQWLWLHNRWKVSPESIRDAQNI